MLLICFRQKPKTSFCTWFLLSLQNFLEILQGPQLANPTPCTKKEPFAWFFFLLWLRECVETHVINLFSAKAKTSFCTWFLLSPQNFLEILQGPQLANPTPFTQKKNHLHGSFLLWLRE